MKKHNKMKEDEIKENKNNNCNNECNCGCNEGNECTCETEAENNTEGCTGSCDGCSGCSVDPNMLLELLQTKNHDLEEKYIRLQAEYLNFKSRTQNEMSKMLKYEGEDLIKQILTIKDNFERACMLDDNDLSDEVSKFLSGFKMILGTLSNILDSIEVKEIDCLGKEFDPHYEEAVLTEHDESKPANVVLEVYTKGYMYKDKLLRPAMVKVNK